MQNYVEALPPLEKLTLGILLYSLFIFSPSHLQQSAVGNHDPRAHIYARGGEFCQVDVTP
jgi:hypothetical protein